MFDALTARLQNVFKELSRRGKLRPEDVDAALREIRLALLEADVHYEVVKNLIEDVREAAMGSEAPLGQNPANVVIHVMHEALQETLGEPGGLELVGEKPYGLMLVGLQGSGKTTTAAKLARRLQTAGDRVWLVAADPYRPAAGEQLTQLAEEVGAGLYADPERTPAEVCEQGRRKAAAAGAGVVIYDTAGRSQLDRDMMDELETIQARVQPVEVLLVADAMTGQEAVNIALGFREALGLTGLILTKMDGDARGGAAISMRAVTNVPIKFIGVGEARDALEPFQPDRLASRILGMGDPMSLVEKAGQALDADLAQDQVSRLLTGEFTLEDFAQQLAMIRRMGPLGKILELLPAGLGGAGLELEGHEAERQLTRTQAMIQSMTVSERRNPDVLNASRKRRVAAGSGTSVQEVNQLLRQYRQMRRLFKRLSKSGMGGMLPFRR
jgi:signal recognition particle subunit SRP54